MKDVTQEQRWTQWLVQAQNFARREQFVDALARARLVRKHVEGELRTAADEERRERLQRYLNRVDRQIERIKRERDAWWKRIADRYQERIAHQDEVVSQPLPGGLPGRPRPRS